VRHRLARFILEASERAWLGPPLYAFSVVLGKIRLFGLLPMISASLRG